MRSFTLDGVRYQLTPRAPIGDIKFLVNRMNVTASDEEVRKSIEERLFSAGADEATATNCSLYALFVHRQNQALYQSATKGP